MSRDIKRIGEIFNNRIFRIPDYQRGYAWEDKHRLAFWQDLELLRQIGHGTHHYTGLIALEILSAARAKEVLPKEDWWLVTGNHELCFVVDGQQRLTTLVIFIHELLQRHAELTPTGPDALNATTRRTDAVKRFLRKENLMVPDHLGYLFGYANNQEMDQFFRSVILDDDKQIGSGVPTSAYARQLHNAKVFFKKRFQTITSASELASWYELIESRLLFNVFEVKDEFDVCLTFEAMNNRGKALTDLEKLKSRVLYLAGLTAAKDPDIVQRDQKLAAYRVTINHSWAKAYELLGWSASNVLDDDAFLQLVWVLRFGSPGTSRDEHLFSQTFTPRNAIDKDLWPAIDTFSRDLAACSAPWVIANLPEQASALHQAGLYKPEIPTKIMTWLKRLKRLGSASFRPLVVAALVHFEKGHLNESQVILLLTAIERYIFLVFGLTERRSDTGRNAYLLEASNLYLNPAKLQGIITRMTDELTWRHSNDSFIAAVKSRQILGSSSGGFYGWDYLTYMLYEYELHLHQTRFRADSAKVTWQVISSHSELAETVEHIYPQNALDHEWPEFAGLTTQEKNLVMNSLGNLLLLSRSKNSSLKRKPFMMKATGDDTAYKNGCFSEMVVANDYQQWTSADIYKRTADLLNFMGSRWSPPDWGTPTKQILDQLAPLITMQQPAAAGGQP